MSFQFKTGRAQTSRHAVVFSLSTENAPRLRSIQEQGPTDWVPERTQRVRLWELTSMFHCSIVGTCLTTAEVRQVLSKLDAQSGTVLTEHQVHARGVLLAGKSDFAGKLLNKALDRRHATHISRFSKAKTVDDVRKLWRSAMDDGDIPGAYWAAMTHPVASDDLLRSIFDDVHMLSHLVGAANRADIRRLRELEGQNELLAGKVERQQVQLRDLALARNALVNELDRVSRLGVEKEIAAPIDGSGGPELSHVFQERLAKLMRRCERLEATLARRTTDLAKERARTAEGASREAVLLQELAALEASQSGQSISDASRDLRLQNRTILYVGGRTHHIPKFRMATTSQGGDFLHHDGGDESSSRLIAPLVGRADLIVFPVDCVSHQAIDIVKATCRKLGKPYLALRASGLASFVAGLKTHFGKDSVDKTDALEPIDRRVSQ